MIQVCYNCAVDFQINYNMNNPRSNLGRLRQLIKSEYLQDLKWNIYTKDLLYKNQLITLEYFEGLINDVHDVEFDFDKLTRTVSSLVPKYNPVLEYLKSLDFTYDLDYLKQLINSIFGITDDLETIYLIKFLVAAVARIYEPGCKVDNVLILQGKQGAGKSTVFHILAGDYFEEFKGNLLSKDTYLTLHSAWILEWSEIDAFLNNKNIAEIKNFISCQSDNYRELYAKETKKHPRQCVLAATTNKKDFLKDETGNRRFWVVNIPNKINLDLLKVNRDIIWSIAKNLYKNNYQWWLNETEQQLSNDRNLDFIEVDAWYTPISEYLTKASTITTHSILKAINQDTASKSNQIRVGKIMTMLGYERKRLVLNNIRDYYWLQS